MPLQPAQATKAELYGSVHDAMGRTVPSAVVTLDSHSNTQKRQSVVGIDGMYHFLALSAGKYRIDIMAEGFAPFRREGIVLRVGDRLSLDFELEVAGATQAIEVTAAPDLLKTSRGSVGFVVEQEKVVTLPLDGRNFVPLIALAPGVSLPPGSVLPRINGSRPRVSEYIYDGISVLQPEPGQVAYYPVIDAIEEFRVETNSYSAEYGRSNGGVIMVNQKSGSNELHGTLFEFFRNERLNARNLFAATGPKPRFRRNQYGFILGGPIRRNKTFYFGDWQGTRLDTGVVRISTVPVPKERDGVFGMSIYDPATTSGASGVYTRSPFPANTIPANRMDRAALHLLSRYPAPNVLNAAGATPSANNYRRIGNNTTAADQLDGRIDHYFSSNHRFFTRYSFMRDDSKPTRPLPDGSGALAEGVIGDTLTRAGSLAAEHSWTVTSAAVNLLRFGYTRRGFERESLRTGQSASQVTLIPNIPATSFSDTVPTFDVVGFQQIGPPPSANSQFSTSVTQLVDTFSWIHGRHSLKAGADIRLATLDILQPPSPAGHFRFTNVFTAGLTPTGSVVASTGNSLASFLLGQTSRFSIDAQPETLKPRAAIGEFFLQDDWQATRRLALSLGVRYTLNFPSTVAGDRAAVFNLDSQRLDFLGANGVPRSARELERANFAPRVGVAFRVTDAFVLRAGYGLTWIEQAGITTPFTTPLFPFIQTLGEQSLDNLTPAFVLAQGPTVRLQSPGPDSGLGQGVFGVQRDNGSGYAQQWNFMLQRTWGSDWSVEAGYLGSKLTRLGVPDVNLNQLTVEQLALGASLTQQVPNPLFGQLPPNTSLSMPTIARGQLLRPYPRFITVALYRNNIGHSTYHSFQARIEKRFSGGLTFTASYTFSRLIDDAGAVFDSAILTGPVMNFQAADSHNKRLEKDVSTGNIPHNISSGFVHELPFGRGRPMPLGGWREWLAGGWQVTGMVRLQSGSPVAVMQATNLNAFAGFGIQRPNRVANPVLPTAERSTGRWFNTAAFAQAPQFTIGNSSRNPVHGPGYRTADVMVGKSFILREGLVAEFRAEAFNVTNTPPLGNPNGSYGSPGFGAITTALDPRVFEFVLKLRF
ncbi:MAG TPA: TonB-dependent receptor [Bryobacteraceae bacterium]|nr:TonB-dependent receptor [Bryobacteraceae bacterium]